MKIVHTKHMSTYHSHCLPVLKENEFIKKISISPPPRAKYKYCRWTYEHVVQK